MAEVLLEQKEGEEEEYKWEHQSAGVLKMKIGLKDFHRTLNYVGTKQCLSSGKFGR